MKDLNKNIIDITYNYQNLPVSINKRGENRIEYDYDAVGNKLCQRYILDGSLIKTTDFVSNFVYEDGIPAWVIHDEGRVVFDQKNGVFAEAFLKDHLGNVRVAVRRSSGQTTIRQIDSYYPFGKTIRDLSRNGRDDFHPNEYLYNGKMHQDELGLNWLDYGARFYDPVLGRWHSLDPKAYKYSALTPYNYVANNPIKAIDPDGKEIVIVGSNKTQTYNDLAIIYATPMGKQMIDALDKSSTVYKIDGSARTPIGSGYRPFWGKAKYYQGEANEEGTKFRSFEMLGHELFHAYQDETNNIEGHATLDVEKGAVMFENYLRKVYSDGAGTQRLTYMGNVLFKAGEKTAYNTGGEKREVNSVSTYVRIDMGMKPDKKEEKESIIMLDNTRNIVNISHTVSRIIQYMDETGLKRVVVNF